MKKIGILAYTKKEDGGVFQYTQSLIDSLKMDKKKEYIIFTNIDNHVFDNNTIEVRKINKPYENVTIKIIRLLQRLFFIRKAFFFKKNELNAFADIDFFISPGISCYPHFYLNKPFIFTLHDMQEKYFPNFFNQKIRLKRFSDNRALLKFTEKVLCESDFVKNDIMNFTGTKAAKIIVIKSPPPEEFITFKFKSSQYEVVRKKYDLPQKYIFYPAQCWFHKNHIKLVEAFNLVQKEIDDVYLVLTGSQQNNYNNLIKRIDELELGIKVKHLGYIDYEDLPYLYTLSKMLVMPTLFESVSIPIYEAFALKVPVCSSNVVALPEQVGNAGILFNPMDERDIANKILMYLRNEKLLEEKAILGFKKIIEFNHNNYSKDLINIMQDCV